MEWGQGEDILWLGEQRGAVQAQEGVGSAEEAYGKSYSPLQGLEGNFSANVPLP